MGAFYDYSKAAKLTDLFDEKFLDELDLKTSQITGVKFNRGKRVKLMFVRNVFTFFLALLIQECIQHNYKFLFNGKHWFYIFIKRINNGNFNRIMKNGTYKRVDLIASDFKIYQFVFYSKYLPAGDRYRRININYDKYNELIDQVNQGKRYYE
jgi:hypothetical protein